MNSPSNFSGYAMNITATGLVATKTEGNSVTFINNKGESVFILDTPYMYDSTEEFSHDIHIEIEETQNGCKIIFTPNAEWLNAADRVYPITIDPIVYSPQTQGNAYDTYVYEGSGATGALGDRMYIGLRSVSGSRKIHRAYWRVLTLPSGPTSANITNATFYAKCLDATTTSRNFSLYGVNGSWSESGLTWANRPSETLLVSDVARSTVTNKITFSGANVTQRIKNWYANTTTNYGFMIRYTSESLTNPDYNSIYSCDSTLSGYFYPTIAVTYNEASITAGTYYLKNRTGNYLDVFDGGTTNGTKTWQHSFNGTAAQQWTVSSVGNGMYELAPGTNTGMRLDVSMGADENNRPLLIFGKNNTAAQRWRFLANGDGTYRLMPEISSTKVLDVYGGSGTNKDDAVLYTYLAINAQKWKMALTGSFVPFLGTSSRTITLQLVGATTQSTTWTTIINNSRNAWNNSSAATNITTTTSTSPHKLTVDSYPAEGWHGLFSKTAGGGSYATSSTIQVNLSTIPSNAYSTFGRSTVTHEMGHLFCLNDNPPTTSATLMSHSRDRYTLYVPQAFDTNNVLFLYT